MFVCAASTATEFVCGDDSRFLPSYAVYGRARPAPCASRLPNPWGFFDLHGNVKEWCHDLYPLHAPDAHIYRGGSFGDMPETLRTRETDPLSGKVRVRTLGFRVARSHGDGTLATSLTKREDFGNYVRFLELNAKSIPPGERLQPFLELAEHTTNKDVRTMQTYARARCRSESRTGSSLTSARSFARLIRRSEGATGFHCPTASTA
jgi:hypothetical protein